jgi:hypothetical protein
MIVGDSGDDRRQRGTPDPVEAAPMLARGITAQAEDLMGLELDSHYKQICDRLIEGRVIPFLGAGVNLCGRPHGAGWVLGRTLPSGSELSRHLAERFNYRSGDGETPDLMRVSQFAAVMDGAGPLYEKLRQVFNADYTPTPLHSFLASLPGIIRGKGYPPRHQLIITTNYDDVLEQAFHQAGEPFDLVVYVADGKDRGKFWHYAPSGEPRVIDRPNKYRGLSLEQRTVIVKLHGAVDRDDEERDSFVITEDHYIDYLIQTEITNLLPVPLPEKLKRCHFLFMGYALKDWNLRVILRRIWLDQQLNWKSWAIEINPEEIEVQFWLKRNVDIIKVSLEQYIAGLGATLDHWPTAGSSS